MDKLQLKIEAIETKLGDQGRVLVRHSGTQNLLRVMVEGENQGQIEEYAQAIVQEIEKGV